MGRALVAGIGRGSPNVSRQDRGGAKHEVAPRTEYVIIGKIESPCGKSPRVKTIWVVDIEMEAARLVTAYPQKE